MSDGREYLLRAANGHICILDGDKMKPRFVKKDRAGGNGFGLSTENVSYTITVRDRHMVGVVER